MSASRSATALRLFTLLMSVATMRCTLVFDECLIEGRCVEDEEPRTCERSRGGPWLATFGGGGSQSAVAVAVDDCDGSVVVAGETSQDVTVHPAEQILAMSGGQTDLVLTRFASDGAVVFAKAIGGQSGGDAVRVGGVAIDERGHTVVVGAFDGTVDFGGETATARGQDAFVASYNRSGQLRWLLPFGGAQDDIAQAVTIDGEDIWVTGGHSPGARFFGEEPTTSDPDAFVLRLTVDGTEPEGRFLWRWGGADAQSGYSIQVDGTRAYVAGTFLTEVDPFSSNPVTATANSEVFIASLLKGGDQDWLSSVRGDGNIFEPHLVINGNTLSATVNADGRLTNACFDEQPSTGAVMAFNMVPSTGDCAEFLRMGGNGDDAVAGLSVDAVGNVVMAGTYDADLITPDLEAEDASEIFVASLSAELDVQSSERVRASGDADVSGGLAIGPSGERVLVGSFSEIIEQADDMVSTDGGLDGFVVYTP